MDYMEVRPQAFVKNVLVDVYFALDQRFLIVQNAESMWTIHLRLIIKIH